MKTSMNRMNWSGRISLLNWPDGVSSSLGEAIISRPKFQRRAEVPDLRIVPAVRKNDLFSYAIAAKSVTAFWETIAYTAVALGAAGALAVAFGI